MTMKTTLTPSAIDERTDTGLDVVTGAFSYSGAAIAAEVVRRGRRVRTITGHPQRAGSNAEIEVRLLDFDDLPGLVASLDGATTLYNTYWVRFAHGRSDHQRAVENSRTLFCAARRAGVQRIVHISVTNPSIGSPYPYFRGKALVERALAEIGISYAILRPAILFGGDGVLINNIAYLLRHLPIFAVGGRGDYHIRGIHIDDLAAIAADAGASGDDAIIDAVGPDRPTFTELVHAVRTAVGSRSLIIRVPAAVVPVAARCLGVVLRDVLLTKDEYKAMAANLADTSGPSTGHTSLLAWIELNASNLGVSYANEFDRHFRVSDPQG